jgi:hypothetical protein
LQKDDGKKSKLQRRILVDQKESSFRGEITFRKAVEGVRDKAGPR